MASETCILNDSPTNDRVIRCEGLATVNVREQRSADFKRITGRDYTMHAVCSRHAQEMITDPRFTIAQ